VDLTAFQNLRLDALLFGESQARVVISVAAVDATKVLERAKLLGLPAAKLGSVGGDKLIVKTAAGEIAWPARDLHDAWWNAIARLMKT
jgi:phosphoribosylformylglycinamidine synthase